MECIRMTSNRINAHLPELLAEHVARVVGPQGYYETPSEYIRSLIRRDMEESDIYQVREAIREGYRDISTGRYFLSTGNFFEDREEFKKKETEGWK